MRQANMALLGSTIAPLHILDKSHCEPQISPKWVRTLSHRVYKAGFCRLFQLVQVAFSSNRAAIAPFDCHFCPADRSLVEIVSTRHQGDKGFHWLDS